MEFAGIAFDLIVIRTWTGNSCEKGSAFNGVETLTLRTDSPLPMRTRYDFLANDPYYLSPFAARASYCTSDRMSVYTSASKVRRYRGILRIGANYETLSQSTTKTAVSEHEHRPLPKLPPEGYLKFNE